MENLRVKVIISKTKEDFEQEINKFSSTDVTVIATQTSFSTAGNESVAVTFMAVVYYKPKLPSLGATIRK